MRFKQTRNFKKDYNRLFHENPETANLFLLLCELSDKGRVITSEEELSLLMQARFNDLSEYALKAVSDE